MQRVAITRSNGIYDKYKSGEEWLMSEGDGDLVKAIINNTRSAIGGMVEDGAYILNDIAPWYKPAQKVLENNTAGQIEETASKQFANAKEGKGDIVSNAVDFLDSASKEAGFSLLGISAGNYLQIAGECFDEYRKLREMGYSREEAFGIATEKAMIAILSLKADDYFEKSNLVDDVLYGKEGIIRKVDSDKIKDYNGTKLGKQEYARLESAINTNHPNEKGYVMQILDNENGDPAITYDVYIKDDGSLMVFGIRGGTNIHERSRYKNAHRK